MIKAEDLNFAEVMFIHLEDGKTTHFAIDRLETYCRKERLKGRLRTAHIPVDPDFADFCRLERGIEQHRVDRITLDILRRFPVIYAKWKDGSHLLLDGHHRYVWASEHGIPEIKAFLLPEKVWSSFIVEGMDDKTEVDLRTRSSGL